MAPRYAPAEKFQARNHHPIGDTLFLAAGPAVEPGSFLAAQVSTIPTPAADCPEGTKREQPWVKPTVRRKPRSTPPGSHHFHPTTVGFTHGYLGWAASRSNKLGQRPDAPALSVSVCSNCVDSAENISAAETVEPQRN